MGMERPDFPAASIVVIMFRRYDATTALRSPLGRQKRLRINGMDEVCIVNLLETSRWSPSHATAPNVDEAMDDSDRGRGGILWVTSLLN